MKEKKGSSRQAILKYMVNTYKVDANTLMVNKAIKKMVEDGKLVAGAQAGKSGSGSFKVSNEEKARIKQEEKMAAKKLLKKKDVSAKPAKSVPAKKPANKAKKSKSKDSKAKITKSVSAKKPA